MPGLTVDGCVHHIVDPNDLDSEKSYLLNQLLLLFYGISETLAIRFGDVHQPVRTEKASSLLPYSDIHGIWYLRLFGSSFVGRHDYAQTA